MKADYFNFKNLHLILSSCIIIPIAFAYGLLPGVILPRLFHFEVDSVDLCNIFRTVMTMYLGIAGIWILGVANLRFWRFATILNVVFMATLAIGRMISIIFDGWPSMLFVVGMCGEFGFAVYGMAQLRQYNEGRDSN